MPPSFCSGRETRTSRPPEPTTDVSTPPRQWVLAGRSGAIALITFPITLGLVAVSGLLIPIAFGEGWQPVVALLAILAPVGVILFECDDLSRDTSADVIRQAV